MPRFDVDFADPKRYFHPGETLAGTIAVRVDEPMRTKGITLEFEGKSHVSWTTGHGKDMKFHWNNEEYFKHKDILLPPTSPPEEGIPLQVGDYIYPFQYQLPNPLPPSFIAPITSGYVQYCMNVTVEDIAHSAPHHPDSQVPFKVVSSPVDLNETRHLLEPRSETVEKILCCLCCQSGPIHLRAEVQKQAFQAGEPLVFSFELDNKATNKPLRKIEARLMQRVTFYSSSREETQEFTICSEVLSEGISPGGEGTWKDTRLNLPADTVPNFECKCMLVEYFPVVSVDIESAFDPKVIFLITVANGVRTTQPRLMGSENGLSINADTVVYRPPAGPSQPEYLSQTASLPLSTVQPQSSGLESQPANCLPPAQPPPPYSGHLPPSNPPEPTNVYLKP